MRVAHFDRRSVLAERLVSLARWTIAGLLSVVAVVALLVGMTVTVLRTSWGSERVRRIALPKINAAMAGQLRIGHFRFGGNDVTLDGIVLIDDDGLLVARADRIKVTFSPLALLRQRMIAGTVDVDRPWLNLVTDQRGLNLTRALAARGGVVSPPDKQPMSGMPKRAGGPVIELRRLSIRDASIELQDRRPGAMPVTRDVQVQSIDLDGHARLDGDHGGLDIAIEASGRARQPVSGPLTLAVRAAGAIGTDGALNVDGIIQLALGKNSVRLSTQVESSASRANDARALSFEQRAVVKVERMLLTPALLRVLVPAASVLRADVSVSGGGSWDGRSRQVQGRLVVQAGGASVVATGSADLKRQKSDGVSVRARHIDLSRLLVAGPPSDLGFDIDGHGEGHDLSTLRGAVTLSVPRGRFGGRTLGPVRLNASADQGRYKVVDLAAAVPGARLIGAGEMTGTRMAFRGAVDLEDLGALVGSATSGKSGTLPRASGRGRVEITLGGSVRAPSVSLRGELRSLSWQDKRLDRLSFSADVANVRMPASGRIRVNIPVLHVANREVRDLALSVRGSAEAVNARATLRSPEPIELDLDATLRRQPRRARTTDQTNLETLAARLLEARARIRGRVTTRAPAVDVLLTLDAHDRLATVARAEMRLPPTGALEGRTTPSVMVRVPLGLAALLQRAHSRESLMRIPMHVEGTVDRVGVGSLTALGGYRPAVTGTISARVALDGTITAPQGQGSLEIAGFRTGHVPATDATVRLVATDRDVRANLEVTRRASKLLRIDARLLAPATHVVDTAALVDAPLAVNGLFGPFEIQRLGLPPENDRSPPRVLRGRVRTEFQLLGTAREPRVKMRIDAADVRIDKSLVGSAQADISYQEKAARADITLTSANQGSLRLNASANVDLGYPRITLPFVPGQIPIAARLDAVGFDLSGLSGVTRQLRSVGGQLFAAARVTGSAADPRVSGRVEWKDGLLAWTGMGEYRKVHLLVHGDPNHLTLDDLRADSGGGHAVISGGADHREGQGYQVKATTDLHDFPIYVDGQALATVSARATSDAVASLQSVLAKVSIGEAHVALSDAKRKQLQKLAPRPDVVLVDDGVPLNPTQAHKLAVLMAARAADAARVGDRTGAVAARPMPDKRPPTIVVTVDAPRNLWVKGKDANLELGIDPGFRLELADVPRMYGNVVVRRGRVDVAGRRFDLKAGSSVRFSGPTDFPELDIHAQHVNQKENITVLVAAKGPPGHLQISITAPDRPDLSETQLYTLVVTGRLELGGGSAGSNTTSDKAASLVGGLVAAQVQKTLARNLPIDVLTIEAGDGISKARLEAGTYVTSDLYVGYVGNLGADPALLQNRNGLHLEYELTSRWSLEGEYGDAKTGTADVIWTKRY